MDSLWILGISHKKIAVYQKSLPAFHKVGFFLVIISQPIFHVFWTAISRPMPRNSYGAIVTCSRTKQATVVIGIVAVTLPFASGVPCVTPTVVHELVLPKSVEVWTR